FGQRVGRVSALGAGGADGDTLGGYIVVTARDLEEAVALAKGCPGLRHGGGGEGGETTDTPGVGVALWPRPEAGPRARPRSTPGRDLSTAGREFDRRFDPTLFDRGEDEGRDRPAERRIWWRSI